MNAGIVVILLLLVLAFLGIPIYIALGIGTLVALNMSGMPMLILPQKLFAGMNSSSLLAIPFFILAGNLMSRSITTKLIDVANAFIGHIKGSLAMVTVVASGLFGAISQFLNSGTDYSALHFAHCLRVHQQCVGIGAVYGFCGPGLDFDSGAYDLCVLLRQKA